MKDNERLVLQSVIRQKEAGAAELSKASGVPYSSLMSVLSSLEQDGLVVVRRKSARKAALTAEGKDYLSKGLPERRLLTALASGKKAMAMALQECFKASGLSQQEQQIALVWAKKNGWISLEGGKVKVISDKQSDAEAALKAVAEGKDAGDMLAVLLQRKLAVSSEEKTVFISPSSSAKAALKDEDVFVSSLTPQMLKDGSWKGKKFRPYDLKTVSAPVIVGRKHPYQEFLQKIRDKLISLGFQEAHGPLVELEFWNLDALFMAQDHPAREIHDVFLVEDPSKGEILAPEVLQSVRKSHEEGLDGSKGWRYKWDPEIAARLCLRSQTTAVSARALAAKPKPPLKMFSIGRVFRPDEIDWKHFIEFNQCEGIVMDENMSFRELLGYLKRFAVEVFNAEEVKFAPSYFPFTEPSVELYAKIPGKGWAEVGGAGMFRPEMLSALGVDVPVLAWGLGIDRLAMVSMGITDIRDLFSSDIAYLRGGKRG